MVPEDKTADILGIMMVKSGVMTVKVLRIATMMKLMTVVFP